MWPLSPLNQALLIATALLTLGLGASILHGRALKAELAEKTQEIQSIKDAAQAYQDQSEANRRVINDSIPIMVEQAKAEAWKNWKSRFGTGNAACGITANWVPNLPTGAGEANRPQGADAASGEQLAIEACARDAGRLDSWIRWAELNQLPVE